MSLLGHIDHQCKPTQFACSSFGSVSNACVLNSFLCDGDDDCQNGSDEQLEFCGTTYRNLCNFSAKNKFAGQT